MTMLPPPGKKKLGLVIDLDICVGCHACAVACKEWNDGGRFGPLPDENPYGAQPLGVWFNRVHSYEVSGTAEKSAAPAVSASAMSVHFPRSCLHCETPDCVTVCPTGASYKRAEDGIVLVDEDKCIGCKLCSWACPYGAREYSEQRGVMQKCTLCVDRIYNETFRRGRSPAGLRDGLPDTRAALRRSRRRGFRGVETRCRTWRLRSDAGDGLQAGQQISAAEATARWLDLHVGHGGAGDYRSNEAATAVALDGQDSFALTVANSCILPSRSFSSRSFPARAMGCCFCSDSA